MLGCFDAHVPEGDNSEAWCRVCIGNGERRTACVRDADTVI